MLKRLALLLLLCTPAYAQTVTQSGSVTPGHAATWVTSGVIRDAGSAASPATTAFLTSLGIVNNGGPAMCFYTAHPSTLNYNRMCFSVNQTADAQISIQNFGTATAVGIGFLINGVAAALPTISIPGTVGHGVCYQTTGGQLQDCGFVPFSSSLASAHIFVGNGSNVATDVALSGDCLLANTGVITCKKTTSTTNPAISALTMGPWGYQIGGCKNSTGTNGYADGRTATVTISIASPAVITWNSHGLTAGQPIYLTTTGTLPTGLLPMQPGPGVQLYVLAAGLTANAFEVAADAYNNPAVNTSGTQSGVHTAVNSCASAFNFNSLLNYDTRSIFYIEAVGGGAGACKNTGGGGAGGAVGEYLTGLPQNAILQYTIGMSGYGCGPDASVRTPTNGDSSIVTILSGTAHNGQTILIAERGHFSTNANAGTGGNVSGCSGFVDDSSGYCLRQAQQLNNGGDGSHWGLNGSMGGASLRGGGLNRIAGGGANGSGSGYSMVDNVGYDGFFGEILIKCVFGCW